MKELMAVLKGSKFNTLDEMNNIIEGFGFKIMKVLQFGIAITDTILADGVIYEVSLFTVPKIEVTGSYKEV